MLKTNFFRTVGKRIASVVTSGVEHRAPRSTRDHITPNTVDARLAACVLLLEIAYADGMFADEERRHVESTLRAQFGVDACGARRLIAQAEAARAAKTPLWHFTSAARSYSRAQRTLLSDILHDTADFDGAATTQETYAVRRINSLLRVEPAYGVAEAA